MSSIIDTWGDEPVRMAVAATASGSTSGVRSKIPATTVVRDDWEMDDDEEEEISRPTDARNKQIWEDANTKVHHPMPALVISRGSSAASASASLPLNQPPAMRILKRPSPTVSPNQSSANLTPAGETFKEREARYQAARERIFGVSSSTSSDGQDKDGQDKAKNSALKKASSPTPPSNQANSVVRDPRGPSNSTPNPNSENRSDNKGFGERRTKRPPPSTAVPTTIFPVSSSDIPI